jgi:hypothetical protein
MSRKHKEERAAFQHMVTARAAEHILASFEVTIRETLDEVQPFGGVCKTHFSYDMATGLIALMLRILCESDVNRTAIIGVFERTTAGLGPIIDECHKHIARLKAKETSKAYFEAADDDFDFASDEVKAQVADEVSKMFADIMKGGK